MIYDCFPFFNELDLLELRLHELGEVVDRFVLVEATHTFTGQPKPLHYHRHRRRFSRWNSQIVHVVVEDMPEGPNPWVREGHQRGCIARGLMECRADDVILVSDVDEIPRPERIPEYRDLPGVKVFQQRLCYYFLNSVCDTPWSGTRMLSYPDFCRLGGAQPVRLMEGTPVPDGGWHFSFMGGSESIRNKLQAYAHQEYNTAAYTDPERLCDRLIGTVDLFGREMEFKIDAGRELPRYVLENPQRFYDWLYEEPLFHENWYDEQQCRRLAEAYRQVEHLPGDVVEIGCWEGKSTVALANACYPATLWAVDTWLGNLDEDPEHVTVQALRQRDVFRIFLRNIRLLTAGNLQPIVADSGEFLKRHCEGIKFCHIDGSHDYGSVRRDIAGALARLEPEGILCGDDLGPHAPGVTRAVEEMLPGYGAAGKFWWWRSRGAQAG